MPAEKKRKARQTWTLEKDVVEKLRLLGKLHHRTPSGELAAAVDAWIAKHRDELVPEQKTENGKEKAIDPGKPPCSAP
jgi:hypothetical protein